MELYDSFARGRSRAAAALRLAQNRSAPIIHTYIHTCIHTEQLACYLLRTLVHGKPARLHGIASEVLHRTSRYDVGYRYPATMRST